MTMKLYVSWVELLLLLSFASCVLAVFVQRFALHRDLRVLIPGLSQHLATTMLFLEITYLRHRRRIGTRRLDTRVALAFFFPIAVCCYAVILYQRFAE
jgi:hypothetical protein